MPSFSTDDIPQPQRFAHWREVRAKAIFGVSIDLDTQRQGQFEAHCSALPVGGATLVEMHASPYRVARTERDIASSASDSLCIYQQLDGGGWFDAGGAEFIVSAGALATSHSDLPYRTEPITDAGFHLRLVKIPFARCRSLIEREQDLFARPLQVEPGVTALFANYFESFVKQASYLQGVGAEAAVQTLAQLAIVARGMASRQEAHSREAIRAALLQRAKQSIENNIYRHDLSPPILAGLIGISVRQLHLLFEPTGTSYTRYVLSRRLEHARLLLSQCPERSVADIAYACGFDGLSTFYRNFRAAFGASPAEFRDAKRR
jgi:AraC-like DNA-binding protein